MRDYWILSLETSPDTEAALATSLYRHPCLGLESEREGKRVRIRAYFSGEFPVTALRGELQQQFSEVQWLAATRIGLPDGSDRSGEIREVSLAGKEFRLDCGPAFGTGAHTTTQLAAELMAKTCLKERAVLDLGTGSGILAILAKALGAAKVEAVEILPEARENARGNFERNGVGEISLHARMEEVVVRFDIIVANLLAPILLQLRGAILERLAPEATLILSGILESEKASVLEAFSPGRLVAELRREGWMGFCLSYPK
ncbi:MAG: 50S ribosomal protein L11 methyltransferase [Deltaproteobacteria bacterium]|nr:50S ribosomal protein L11 methyltransferase [Deltaproteobacteria bacterium]